MRRRNRPLLVSLAIAAFAIGAVLLFQNLRATFSTLDAYPNASFWNVFLSTQGAAGVEPQLVLFVWGPPILAGLGIVLLVAHFGMRAVRAGAGVAVVGGAAAASQPWQQPQQQGWRPEQQGWQPEQQQPQQPWGQQPTQPGWQPQPAQQQWGQQPSAPQPGPAQPLGGTQPPPPSAADRIEP